MSSSKTDTNTKKSSKSTSPVNKNSEEMSHHTSITDDVDDDEENEDEIKRYINKYDHHAIIAVFEGDYVRFSREFKNGELAEENITSQEEFEKMIEQEEWRKEEDE